MSPNSVASVAHCVKVVEDVVVEKFTFASSSPGEFFVASDTLNFEANSKEIKNIKKMLYF